MSLRETCVNFVRQQEYIYFKQLDLGDSGNEAAEFQQAKSL
jgi:hypothetical protein